LEAREGVGEKGGGGGKGRVMIQSLYTHMNKGNKKIYMTVYEIFVKVRLGVTHL
jgi:hypothetical protein